MKKFALFYSRRVPSKIQILLSYLFSLLFRSKISRLIIPAYCLFFEITDDYLSKFKPASGKSSYVSFHDFFKRKLKSPLETKKIQIWPCEGYVCDWGSFNEKTVSNLKGDIIPLHQVFGIESETTKNNFFVNIFLHNHNYHRIHAPVTGTIKSIKKISGGLMFLRPWFYPEESISLPATTNERVVMEIQDTNDKTWWMTLVGGFGVGTISLNQFAVENSNIEIGQELGLFELGSTVCLSLPYPIEIKGYLQPIYAGEPMILPTFDLPKQLEFILKPLPSLDS